MSDSRYQSSLIFTVYLPKLTALAADDTDCRPETRDATTAAAFERMLDRSAHPLANARYRFHPTRLDTRSMESLGKIDLPDGDDPDALAAEGLAAIARLATSPYPAAPARSVDGSIILAAVMVRPAIHPAGAGQPAPAPEPDETHLKTWQTETQAAMEEMNASVGEFVLQIHITDNHAVALQKSRDFESMSQIRMSLARAIDTDTRTMITTAHDDNGTTIYLCPETGCVDGPYRLSGITLQPGQPLSTVLPFGGGDNMIGETSFDEISELHEEISELPQHTRH